MYYIWLNDTNPKRYYWQGGPVQNWTNDFSKADKFSTAEAAEAEAVYAQRTTRSEVVVEGPQ